MTELVRVQKKFQITLPASFCKAAGLKQGDDVEASLLVDGILLRTASTGKAAALHETSLMAFLNEHRAAPLSRTDVDAQVQQDRGAWDQK